jgi:hypothetical protein
VRTTTSLLGCTFLVTLFACGDPPAIPRARFANQPIVWKVDDHNNTEAKPANVAPLTDLDFYRRSFQRPLIQGLEVPRPRRAEALNALDDVPDSTWFTNRIGRQTLTPEQIATGPLEHDSPEASKPWTVVSSKYGGIAPGLIITDGKGEKYLLKFETAGMPELESGADVVANRLLWAAGYNVPEDRVVYFAPEDLVLAPDAHVKNEQGGNRRKLDRDELGSELAPLDKGPDGKIRAIASRWIDGTTLGPTADTGVRKDDPNDRIPHELRRDQRGAYAVISWLDNTDLPLSNAIDVLVADPADSGRHFVKHYRLDFDSSLAAQAATKHDPRVGFTHAFDWRASGLDTITFGIMSRPWMGRAAPSLRGVSPLFTADHFDPKAWKSDIPVAAFSDSDRFDQFWGAKIVARFTREQIRAAVEQGRYTDPRAVDYLTDTLVARQHAVVSYWFSQVSPLDAVRVDERGLCFDDLAIARGLAPAIETRYSVTSRDRAGKQIGATGAASAASDGSTCVSTLPLSADRDGYTIVELVTTRPGSNLTMYVHVARDPGTGQPRVIGVWRV